MDQLSTKSNLRFSLRASTWALIQLFISVLLYKLKSRLLIDLYVKLNRRRIERFVAKNRRAGFDPKGFTEKPVMQNNFSDYVTDANLNLDEAKRFVASADNIGKRFMGKYVVLATSGTTGVPGVFLWDAENIGRARALMNIRPMSDHVGFLKLLFWFFVRPMKGVALVNQANSAGMLGIIHLPWVLKRLWNYEFVRLGAPWPTITEKITKINPDALFTYPSVMEVLLDHWEKEKIVPKLRYLILFWEPVSDQLKKRLAMNLQNCRLIDAYSSTESSGLGVYCQQGKLHWNEDACDIVPVDQNLKPVPVNEFGESILVTNYFNHVQPIVRYRITDRLRITDQKCACGSPFKVMELSGRTEDTFSMLDNAGGEYRLLPIMMEVNIFLKLTILRQFQVVQTGRQSLTIRVVAQEGSESTAESEIREGFFKLLNHMGIRAKLELSFEFATENLNKTVGAKKFKQFVAMQKAA